MILRRKSGHFVEIISDHMVSRVPQSYPRCALGTLFEVDTNVWFSEEENNHMQKHE